MKFVPTVITSKLGRKALLLQKSSPTVLFGVGVVGVVGGTVLACRATLKLDEVLDEALDKRERVLNTDHPSYSEKDRQHDLTLVRFQTGVAIGRSYLPAVVVLGVGVAALTQSHRILTQRNAAITAAYATLDEAFTKYRGRVIEKYGEDQERDFRFDTEQIAVGKGKKQKEVTRV